MDSTLLKGLSVLERVVDASEPVSVTALARDLGLSKSNVQRVLASLRSAGYLILDDDSRRYYPSLRLLHLGNRVLATFPFELAARGILERIARETGESAHLAVLDEAFVVFPAVVNSSARVASVLAWNTRLPWHETAFGLAAVAMLPEIRQQFRLATPGLPEGLGAMLRRFRADGHAVVPSVETRKVFEIAIPLSTRWGQVFGSLGISGPAARFSQDRVAAQVAAIAAAWDDGVLGD